MSILSLSHTDLDGISAQIVLRYFKGEINRMNISYNKIDEYLEILDEYCIHHKPSEVWVTDLSFEYPDLVKLNKIASKNQYVKFYFIDHHPLQCSDEDIKKLKINNLFLLISSKGSATKLVYRFLQKDSNSYNKDLEKFVEYVNSYDLWKKEEKTFKGGLVYNELFWEYKKVFFFSRFKDEFNLRNSDKENYKKLIIKKDKLFKKLDDSGRIFKHIPNGNKRIFMIFIDSFFSNVTLDFPDYSVYIIITSYGSLSVRLSDGVSDDGDLKDKIISDISENPLFLKAGGHNKAFGITIKEPTPHNLVEFSKFLLEIIDNQMDKIIK